MTDTWVVSERYISGGRMYFDSRRNSSLEPGHRVLAVGGVGDERTFLWQGSVADVSVKETDEGNSYRVSFKNVRTFHPTRRLIDYRFSLRHVYRYDSPNVHYRRPYRSIPFADYEVIRDGIIFWSRTAVGELFAGIPPRTQIAILAEATTTVTPGTTVETSYLKAWQHLRRLIEARFSRPAALAAATAQMWQELPMENGPAVDALTLGGEDNERIYDLGRQLGRLSAFLDALRLRDGTALLDSIDARIRNNSAEEWFGSRVRDMEWPIRRISNY